MRKYHSCEFVINFLTYIRHITMHKQMRGCWQELRTSLLTIHICYCYMYVYFRHLCEFSLQRDIDEYKQHLLFQTIIYFH